MGGGLEGPPTQKSKFVLKQAYFSFLSSKAIKFWVKMEEIDKKLWILQAFQNCEFSQKFCRDNFSLGKIWNHRDKNGHKN